MLSNEFGVPLPLRLEPSKLLLRVQLLAHILALIALGLPSAIPIAVKITLAIFVFANLAVTLRKNKKGQIENITWHKDDIWLEQINGQIKTWHSTSGSLVTEMFVIVTLASEGKKRRLLVVKDQCNPQSFRRLRVKLKYYQGAVAIPADAS